MGSCCLSKEKEKSAFDLFIKDKKDKKDKSLFKYS